MNQDNLTCEKKDRHGFGVCGWPIPCPWHTVIIDLTKKLSKLEQLEYDLRTAHEEA